MRFARQLGRGGGVVLFGISVFLGACSSGSEVGESVIIDGLLPDGAYTEISNAYPELAVSLLTEGDANTAVAFGEQFLQVDGIEDDEARERVASYIVQYLENPNKREQDRAAREEYEAKPPAERLAALIERITDRHPDFAYEWTGLGEGNVEVEYGDNSLLITGIENDGGREEWAHAIIQIQKEIDALGGGDEGEGG